MRLAQREQRANIARLPQAWSTHPFVARLHHLGDFGDDDLHRLWALIESEIAVKKRRDLVVDGYEYRKLCFVEEGFAARYKLLRNGKRQVVNLVLPGDVIGLPGSFMQAARYSVIAVTDLKLQVCALESYVGLCHQTPQFALALSWLAVHEATICAEHIISTGRRTPLERLAHFLLEMHSRLAAVGHVSDDEFVLPLSQEIISDALGLSVPHLNRTLGELRAGGLVAMDGHQVELLDRPALELLGHFQPLNLKRIPNGRSVA
jgi:CRP-like cAMP-binding protein